MLHIAQKCIEFKHLLLHQISEKYIVSGPWQTTRINSHRVHDKVFKVSLLPSCLFKLYMARDDQLTLHESKEYVPLTSGIVSDITNKFIWSGGEPPFFRARNQSEYTRDELALCTIYSSSRSRKCRRKSNGSLDGRMRT